MCGRYGRRSDKQQIAERFRLGMLPEGFVFPDDYNIAPTTFQPVVRLNPETGERELTMMQWELVPRGTRDRSTIKRYSTINARAEGILKSNFFRDPFLTKRCIAPMDFFYEWLRHEVARFGKNGRPLKPQAVKTPFLFRPRDGSMFGVACIYDTWWDPIAAAWLLSFAVITTEANELMSRIHNRMPVILHPRDYARYLDCSNPEQPPIDLLRPYDSELMEMVPCNPLLNHVKNNGPELLVCPNPDVPLSLLNSQ